VKTRKQLRGIPSDQRPIEQHKLWTGFTSFHQQFVYVNSLADDPHFLVLLQQRPECHANDGSPLGQHDAHRVSPAEGRTAAHTHGGRS
jgi:hypothetical protein